MPLSPLPLTPSARATWASIAILSAACASRLAFAAACCGGASAAPTLLTGDDRAQLSASLSLAQVIGDTSPAGISVFRADGDHERTETLRLDGALLLTDRWQAGASLPLVRRTHATSLLPGESASGLGDVSLSGAYEILPEWEYSAWRPRGFAFAQLVLPTGPANYDQTLVETRGRGFYSLGAGVMLIKSWGGWDSSLMVEAHRELARTFADAAIGEQEVRPGWSGSVALGAGYSPARLPLRIGVALSPVYVSKMDILVDGLPDKPTAPQLVWNTSAQLAWMATRSSSLSAAYTDQTLMGPARNVALSRTIALLYQQRWER
jgi:hypothetical protein